ncbi:MAG: nuclear transport factor 2 family protein [Austwickia sp.]|jgi:steroid delta-isomerase|nr:MAG: nuclear transport factor 2 family protein [Austwickia sp.]
MSETERNLASVRRYYALVDADDVPGLVALFAPDAVYRRPGYEPLRGRDDLTAFYSGARVIASGRHTIETEVAGPTGVAVSGRLAGVLKDGTARELRWADFYTFTPEGLLATRDTFFFAPMV